MARKNSEASIELMEYGKEFKNDPQDPIKEASFWAAIINGNALAAFLFTLQLLEKAPHYFKHALLGFVGVGEIIDVFSKLYDLATLKDDGEPDYWERLWIARVKLLGATLAAGLIGAVVFGGAIAGVGVLAAATPLIFLGVCAVKGTVDLALTIYNVYKFFTEQDPIKRKEYKKAAFNHAFGFAVNLALTLTTTIVFMSAPVSFPAMAMIGGAVLVGYVGYLALDKLGAIDYLKKKCSSLWNSFKRKDTAEEDVSDRLLSEDSPASSFIASTEKDIAENSVQQQTVINGGQTVGVTAASSFSNAELMRRLSFRSTDSDDTASKLSSEVHVDTAPLLGRKLG